MSVNNGTCVRIDANPDVSGIGIRVNFYVTMLLIAVIPQTPHTESLLGALYSNAGLSGLGLLITAIIQTAQNQLSLYHALFIQHILFFLGIGVAPIGTYRWNTARILLTGIMQFATLIAYVGWALYMWLHVDSFGPQPGCNHGVKYVLLFFTVRATVGWLKRLWEATLILTTISMFIGFVVGSGMLMWMRRVQQHDGASGVWAPTGRNFYISFPLFFSAIYSTVMLELTVHRNKYIVEETEESTWTFGQVLALVMIITSLNEVTHFLFGLFSRRRGQVEDEEDSVQGVHPNKVTMTDSGSTPDLQSTTSLSVVPAAATKPSAVAWIKNAAKGTVIHAVPEAGLSMTSLNSRTQSQSPREEFEIAEPESHLR